MGWKFDPLGVDSFAGRVYETLMRCLVSSFEWIRPQTSMDIATAVVDVVSGVLRSRSKSTSVYSR
jgi:hypothetical protein